jgi:16S rRNA G1207 methylase RsmC
MAKKEPHRPEAASGTRRGPVSRVLEEPSIFPSETRQESRLAERRIAPPTMVSIHKTDFLIEPGVYQTSVDTELMADLVVENIKPSETFLEVGCGCGAVSILTARRCRGGFGVDINPAAVQNSIENARRLRVQNVAFTESDVFSQVSGKYDVIICNPPYNVRRAIDPVERMFWDPEDEMKRSFFAGARRFLLADGRIFFGWADFPELDVYLPERLARAHGFRIVSWLERPARSGAQRFLVLKIIPS